MSDEETRAALIGAEFAHLVTNDRSGLLVTPLPLLYDESRHSLQGHVARANPHWTASGCHSVAIFGGVQSYISPRFYPTKAESGKVVPTWNYEVLNVYGQLVAHDDPDWLLSFVTRLTNRHEASSISPWQVTDAPEDYTQAQLKAIVGVELLILHVEGKSKMSQNQSARNRAGVVDGLMSTRDHDSRLVAERVAALGDG